MCQTLYAAPSTVTAPYYTYNHTDHVAPATRRSGNASISGLTFYRAGTIPSAYSGALFFGDYSRNCIWVMFPGANGDPDPATRMTFAAGAPGPVDLQIGPGGDLFYINFTQGDLRRIKAVSVNQPPTAVRGEPNVWSPAAERAVRRHRLERSRGRRAHLRLGSGRRRTVHRFVHGDAEQDVHDGWQLQRRIARHRSAERNGKRDGQNIGWQHAAGGKDSDAWCGNDMERRRRDLVSGSASDAQEGTLPASALSWTVMITTVPPTATRTRCRASPVWRVARSSRPTTIIRRISSW